MPKCLLISLKKYATELFPFVPVTPTMFLGISLNFFLELLKNVSMFFFVQKYQVCISSLKKFFLGFFL